MFASRRQQFSREIVSLILFKKISGYPPERTLGREPWETQIDNMSKAFDKNLICLRQLKRCNIPSNDLRTVYLHYVRPTLEYVSPAWFCSLSRECLEKMQRKAFRIILSSDLCRYQSCTNLPGTRLNIPVLTKSFRLILAIYF